MTGDAPHGPVAEVVAAAVEPDGYRVVECAVRTVRKRTQVYVVLYHPNGVNLDRLGEIHATLVPRIEETLGEDGPHIEFSSPGITRTLKGCHEFDVFRGLPARVLTGDDEWVSGRIGNCVADGVTIECDDGTARVLSCAEVRKAQLDG